MTKGFLTDYNNRIFSHIKTTDIAKNKQGSPLDNHSLRDKQEELIKEQEVSIRERQQNINLATVEQNNLMREREESIKAQEEALEIRQQNIIRIASECDLEREALVLLVIEQAQERDWLNEVKRIKEEERERLNIVRKE